MPQYEVVIQNTNGQRQRSYIAAADFYDAHGLAQIWAEQSGNGHDHHVFSISENFSTMEEMLEFPSLQYWLNSTPKFEIGTHVQFLDPDYDYPSDIQLDYSHMTYHIVDRDYRLEYDGWSYVLSNDILEQYHAEQSLVIMPENQIREV